MDNCVDCETVRWSVVGFKHIVYDTLWEFLHTLFMLSWMEYCGLELVWSEMT